MEAQVVNLRKSKPAKRPERHIVGKRARRRQRVAGFGAVIIAGVLTALSLTHLAHGVQTITSAPSWEAYALAVGIDLGFLSCEMAHLSAVSEEAKRMVSKFARPTVIATLGASAILNAFAFANSLEGFALVPAIMLGAAIPALIYSLTRIGVAMSR